MWKNKNKFNMSAQEFVQDAHMHYAWMRDEQPVCEARISGFPKLYLITRYEDVNELLRDPRVIKNPSKAKTEEGRSGEAWMPKVFRPLMKNMLNTDEPDHRRLRNLVHKGFTPRRIRELEPRIEAITNQLVDQAQEKALQDGYVDLVQHFALPLPVTVIAELIGIPEEDRPKFHGWAQRIVVNPTPLNMAKALLPLRNFMRYTRQLADKRRTEPQDDLLSALVQAEDEGERFSEDELLAMVFLLLVAGYETTVGLITNGTLALLSNPEQLEMLRNDMSLMDSAIEEMLRYDGPLSVGEMNFAKEPITLHGVTIPKGEVMLFSILSANRDERVFVNPHQLDITRSPNRHLAFGQGIHYCLGAPLARLESKVAFKTLLNRCPDLHLGIAPDKVKYTNMPILHRVQELPVSF
ncbi:MAG: cytochrome P450 [Chloroflexota bacterium]